MTDKILTYSTPCSEEILKQINEYEFKRLWKNNLKINQRNLFYGITFLVLGAFISYTSSYGYFLLGAGFMYIVFFINYLLQYRKIKKKFFENLNEECLRLRENSKDVTWEFTPTHFSFKNYKSEHKSIWQEITYCIFDDKYLYITASSFMHFILNKDNIDEDNLNKTIQYLESKSKFH